MVKAVGHNGQEETTYTEHIEIVTVWGWHDVGGGGLGEMSFQSTGKMGKNFCPNLSPTFS